MHKLQWVYVRTRKCAFISAWIFATTACAQGESDPIADDEATSVLSGDTGTSGSAEGGTRESAEETPSFQAAKKDERTERARHQFQSGERYLTIDLSEGVTMDFVRIPAGTFTTGTDDPWLRLTNGAPLVLEIGAPFYLARTEVTQRQWRAVMQTNPSLSKGDERPVEQITWHSAKAFCERLGLRLPSGNEWEHACRGGTTTTWFHGDDPARLRDNAWYRENSLGESHPVAQKLPNPFGLFDMHGNVAEWCDESEARSLGPAYLEFRDYAGGSWISDALGVRSSAWSFEGKDYRSKLVGFRPAADAPR